MPPESSEPPTTTSDTLEIVEAAADVHQQDLIKLCDHAIINDGNAIGFLPWGAYTDACNHNRLFSLLRNSDRVGFLLWSSNPLREIRILQIWIRSDARLIEHGRALIEHLQNAHARKLRSWQLRAWVAEDLAANLFWPQVGFLRTGWRWGRAQRGRRHNLWCKPLTAAMSPPSPPPDVQRPAQLDLATAPPSPHH